MRLPLVLGLLLACASSDPDAPRLGCGFGGGLGLTDADGDGYGSTLDCDDADPGVHPEAEERCNGLDDDCDEVTDEADAVDAAIWYPDLDGDGWGDALGKPVSGCTAPWGYGPSGDCLDWDPGVHPGAPEVCDFVDQDCDGLVDDEAVNAVESCPDGDGDGHGDPAQALSACIPPHGWVLACDDCDEADSAVHPGAEDACNGVDDDCDGVVDPLDADADGDGWTGCDGDCDDGDPGVNPGVAEVCGNGLDEGCDGWAGACGIEGEAAAGTWPALLTGASGYDLAGSALAGLGDLTGDGLGEFAVGGEQAVHVLSGAADWPGRDGFPLDAAPWALARDDPGPLAAAGDVDGDGIPDLLAGAPDAAAVGAGSGQGWLVPGAALAAWTGAGAIEDLGWALLPLDRGDELGAAVAGAGDADGDGGDDLLLGAPGTAGGAGAAWLVPGPVRTDLAVAEAGTAWFGEGAEDRAGEAVAAAGDVDGDGLAELLVGAQRSDRGREDGGAAYLLHAEAGGGSLGDAAGVLRGAASGAFCGCALAGVGDATGDGLDDVLIGARGLGWGGLARGGAYLVPGPIAGDLSLEFAALARIAGEEDYGYVGFAVAGPGDLDRDGLPDLAVGAPYADAGLDGQGAVFVFPGSVEGVVAASSAAARLRGGAAGRNLGTALCGAGDVDGDGAPDLLLGLPGWSEVEPFAGAAWLLFGGEGS